MSIFLAILNKKQAMNNKKIKFPIKGHMFPVHNDNCCPMCKSDIKQGQVVLMLEGSASVHAHFHERSLFDTILINDRTCDMHFCSTSCLRGFFNEIVNRLETKNPALKKN
ncbi:MAG: hypothetical protein H6679_03420 [Epsilonproteobacteria bacterium]|nr:hypothetical protein [Campylobacterota bacterium]